MKKDVVIIPTYNERENIANIINRVVLLYPDLLIWVIDDSSPDGTGEIVKQISSQNPNVSLFVKKEKAGLGEAYKHIHRIIQKRDDIRNVVTMDADGSHHPESITQLLGKLKDYGLAIGSRYTPGGRVEGWDKKRFLLSYFGNIYNRLITGLPVFDGTAGFVAFRAEALKKIDLALISSSGYSYQIEFKNALIQNGEKYCEVPIVFSERQLGRSKMSGQIIAEGLLMPWRILFKNKEMIKKQVGRLVTLAIFVIAIFFSTYRLSESPSVWYDEGIYYQMSANLVDYDKVGLVVTPGNVEHFSKISVGFPLIYPIASFLAIFGNNILAARAMMVVFLLALLVVAYFLVRNSIGKIEALLSLSLLASFAPLYGNGKSVLGEVPGILYLLLSLFLINLARIKNGQKISKYLLALAGISAGLCVSTKPIFIIFAGSLIFVFLFKRKEILSWGQKMFLFPLFFIITITFWILTQFQLGDSSSQILAFYLNPQNTANLFSTVISNIGMFFTELGSVYLLIALIIWSLSIIIRYKKQKIGLEETISFVFSILITLAFLRTSGYLRYLFPAQILSIIYLPSSLLGCWGYIQTKIRKYSSVQKIFSQKSVIILISVLFIFGVYQLMFNSWVADSYNSRKTAFWEEYFKSLPKEEKIYFYDTPEVAMFMKNRNYYQYLDLSPAGLVIGENNNLIINKVGVNRVILKTNIFQSNKELWNKYYRVEKEVFKYTILMPAKK